MKKRITSLVLAIVMAVSSFSLSACGRDELKDKLEENEIVEISDIHEHSQEDTANTANNGNPLKTEASDVKSDKLVNDEAEVTSLRAQLAEAEEENAILVASNAELATALEAAKKDAESKVTEAQAEVTKIKEEKTTLLAKITSYDELEAANKKLQAAYDELVKLQESGWVVIGDKAYCRYEYAVKRTLNQLSDGTWYHQAKSQVKEVVLYDDIIIGGNTMVYLDKTVEMARKDWNIAISFDGGNSIYAASIGNYKWSQNAAFQGGVLKTGYKLVETEKNGNFGRQDTIAQYIIGYVANDKAELGVDFYIKAGLYEANPTVKPACNHGKDCHCGNCDKCPALEPEKVVEVVTKTEVKTEYVKTEVKVEVCPICIKENCEGHCGICREFLSKCTCEVKTVYVPGETQYIEVPGETVYVEVPGETQYIEVPGETQYIEVPGETVYVEVPGETVYVEVPGETVYVEVPGETVYVDVYLCNKCKNPIEDCTCGDSDHNDLEDIPNPNPDVKPGHNELEDVENPNQSGGNNNSGSNSGSNHNGLGESSNTSSNSSGSHSSSNKQSSHSSLDD